MEGWVLSKRWWTESSEGLTRMVFQPVPRPPAEREGIGREQGARGCSGPIRLRRRSRLGGGSMQKTRWDPAESRPTSQFWLGCHRNRKRGHLLISPVPVAEAVIPSSTRDDAYRSLTGNPEITAQDSCFNRGK